jgi:hypothetical protein
VVKDDIDVAREIYQSVMLADKKQKKMISSRFWERFGVAARQPQVIERIKDVLDKQGLKVEARSENKFGDEHWDEWIIITPKIIISDKATGQIQTIRPNNEWFHDIKSRDFESEREVETYFVVPLLEKLGYEYDDIVIGYPVEMFIGTRRTKTEADLAIFNGRSRERKDALLIIEAKKSDNDIKEDHIEQAKSYAQVLTPACYIVTNGIRIKVFLFNGSLAPDECILDFDRSMLIEKWDELYQCVSKKATVLRKHKLLTFISKEQPITSS